MSQVSRCLINSFNERQYIMTTNPSPEIVCHICRKPIIEESYVADDVGPAHGKCVQEEMHRQMYGDDPGAPSDDDLRATLDAMETNGGGFVSSLAIALRKADPNNSRKLREVLPEYFKQYTAVANELAARKAVKS